MYDLGIISGHGGQRINQVANLLLAYVSLINHHSAIGEILPRATESSDLEKS